ncbi:hypothetical protein GGR57DRAFT_515373 [Xylariaceae sp. FL1272]|nr:hypothetical protein GGR57DRAFT_515373 [Xylariaceae sp. FL1272]
MLDPLSNLGSDSWIGSDAFEPGDEFEQRASNFIATVNWDTLLSLATGFRNGNMCELGDKFSIGQSNMVRRIIFGDQVSWIARLRMPPVGTIDTSREAAEFREDNGSRGSEHEISQARPNLRPLCPLSTPSVRITEDSNTVGAPYILMDYVHGNVAYELRLAKDCALGLSGTEEQDKRFKRQMSEKQATLATFTFDHIGSLCQDEATGEFFIGPDIETSKVCARNAPPEVVSSPSFALPVVFNGLMKLFAKASTYTDPANGSYCLTNGDLGPHNLLVDDELNTVGVIDLDGIMAAPIEVAAQLPQLAALDPEPPGYMETNPVAIERIKRTESLIKEYIDMIKQIEENFDSKGSNIGTAMLSDGARIVQGLGEYKSHQNSANDRWMDAFVRLLAGHYKSSPGDSSESVGFNTAIELQPT